MDPLGKTQGSGAVGFREEGLASGLGLGLWTRDLGFRAWASGIRILGFRVFGLSTVPVLNNAEVSTATERFPTCFGTAPDPKP